MAEPPSGASGGTPQQQPGGQQSSGQHGSVEPSIWRTSFLASMNVDTLTDTSTAVNMTDVKLIQTIDAECCPQLLAAPLDEDAAERLAAALRVLADPARLRLLGIIGSHPRGEACVCELTGPVGLSQPTVSHHLKVLTDAGLVGREQRGRIRLLLGHP